MEINASKPMFAVLCVEAIGDSIYAATPYLVKCFSTELEAEAFATQCYDEMKAEYLADKGSNYEFDDVLRTAVRNGVKHWQYVVAGH